MMARKTSILYWRTFGFIFILLLVIWSLISPATRDPDEQAGVQLKMVTNSIAYQFRNYFSVSDRIPTVEYIVKTAAVNTPGIETMTQPFKSALFINIDPADYPMHLGDSSPPRILSYVEITDSTGKKHYLACDSNIAIKKYPEGGHFPPPGKFKMWMELMKGTGNLPSFENSHVDP